MIAYDLDRASEALVLRFINDVSDMTHIPHKLDAWTAFKNAVPKIGTEQPETWAVVELMGHQRAAGRLTEEERFGAKLGRLDIPREKGFTTIYFGGSSVYRLTVTTEEIARAVSRSTQPKPVYAYELEAPRGSYKSDDDEY